MRPPLEVPILPFAQRCTGPTPGRVCGDPRSAEVTSPYGWRANPFGSGSVFHGGIDIGNGHLGVPVVAIGAGRVIAAGELGPPWSDWSPAWPSGNYGGTMVIIDHGGAISQYAHLARREVSAGATVAAGQPIGAIGDTGSAAGQGHLHLGIQVAGAWVDGWPLISEEDEVQLPAGFVQGPGNRRVVVNHGEVPTLVRSEPSRSDPGPVGTIIGRSRQPFELIITGHVDTAIGRWWGGPVYVGGASVERYGGAVNGWQVGWVYAGLCGTPGPVERSIDPTLEKAARAAIATLGAALP